jgi:hypothetical protein
MTASDFLNSLVRRGVRLEAGQAGGLRVTAPPGCLATSDRDALVAHKADLLALLDRAGQTEACALALVDELAGDVLALGNDARQRVLDQFRIVIRRYRATFDPMLFEAENAVRLQRERWQSPTPAPTEDWTHDRP